MAFAKRKLPLVVGAEASGEIANVALPAKAVSNIALVANGSGPPVIAVGLSDGSLVLIRKD